MSMVRCFFLWVLVAWNAAAVGQHQLRVELLLADAAQTDSVYLTGNFAQWRPDAVPLQRDASGVWVADVLLDGPLVHLKFTRGHGASFECLASGQMRYDRSLWLSADTTVHWCLEQWTDRMPYTAPSEVVGTLTPLADSVYMPTLERWRRIWVWVPPDYDRSNQRYPVLYAHDAQNLFDNQRAYTQEWGLDETLMELYRSTGTGVLAVAVEHGGPHRIDELTAFAHQQIGGHNEGYTQFLERHLKPHIDSLYRTLPQAEHTAVLGSSLGALASLYAACTRPWQFGTALAFSPSLWFSERYFELPERLPKGSRTRFYFLAGGLESVDMVAHAKKMASELSQVLEPSQVQLRVAPDGQHHEWFWRRELPAALRWWLNKP